MTETKNSEWVLIGLCLLMLATRFDHFGTIASLPDASIAIFFFGGLYLRNMRWFVLLLIQATLMDFVAIEFGGVSDFCISPAYVFLVPTYGVLWASGLLCSRFNVLSINGLLITTGSLITAISVAFLISNSSFYLFSGRITDLNWTHYLDQILQYYPPYLLSALIYASIIAIIHATSSLLTSTKQQV